MSPLQKALRTVENSVTRREELAGVFRSYLLQDDVVQLLQAAVAQEKVYTNGLTDRVAEAIQLLQAAAITTSAGTQEELHKQALDLLRGTRYPSS